MGKLSYFDDHHDEIQTRNYEMTPDLDFWITFGAFSQIFIYMSV